MRTPASQGRTHGIVAILDALGASHYSEAEIARFLKSRELVLEFLNSKVEKQLGNIDSNRISTFTFNDTVVIAFRTDESVTFNEVSSFSVILRKFLLDSLSNQILFRGAISIGAFFVDDDTNTIMGRAITDAAAW